jgi:hypothetical protein
VEFFLQDVLQTTPHDGVIIGNQYSGHIGFSTG